MTSAGAIILKGDKKKLRMKEIAVLPRHPNPIQGAMSIMNIFVKDII
jgi:hypothetical protein